MSGGTRTEAACLAASMAEIPHLRPITTPVVDVTDPAQFPEIAKARAHFASLSPERLAELEQRP